MFENTHVYNKYIVVYIKYPLEWLIIRLFI